MGPDYCGASGSRAGRRGLYLVAVVLLGCGLCPSLAPVHAEGRALLIGCTEYPQQPRETWLRGGTNDVELLKKLLTGEPFRFKPENVTTLAGWPKDEKARPTRANIERAFRKLARRVRSGDQVVIALSGHGSQQPANEDPDDPEPDGFDEIFLPADIKGWDQTKRQVTNAILDDDIREWVQTITEKRVFVWLIFDSCHSGTMVRGAPLTQERERRLASERLVPAEALAAARARAKPAGRTRGYAESGSGTLDACRGEVVAMYAAQSSETTLEMPLPGRTDPQRGLFTYTLAQVILESSSPLTYRELAERVVAQYRGRSRWQPTPLIEGKNLDREVLGVRSWPARPSILLSRNRSGEVLQLAAGNLHGLRPGSVFAVYPPAGQKRADLLIGYVQATRVKPLTSVVEPIEFDGRPAPRLAKLVDGCRCQVAFVNYGAFRMGVAVQTHGPKAVTHPSGKGPAVVEAAVKALCRGPCPLLERVDDPAAADWFVRVRANRVFLVPSSGWAGRFLERGHSMALSALSPPQFVLGNLTDGQGLTESLAGALVRIARARHLICVASAGNASRTHRGPVSLHVDLLRFKDESDQKGQVVRHESSGRILAVGDIVAFRVTNPGRYTVDVTLLFIDSAYGIYAVFPEPGTLDDNRLGPGKTMCTPRIEVTGDTCGPEQLVAIAVRAEKVRQNFSCLEQPSLERVRGAESLSSPLGQLLQTALYGSGETRGLRRSQVDNYAIRLLPWMTVPAPSEQEAPEAEPMLLDALRSRQRVRLKGKLVVTPETVSQLLVPKKERTWKPAANPERLRGGVNLYKKVAPAVVVVRTEHGHGTGFLISADGWILTNHHVIASGLSHDNDKGASFAMVHLGTRDADGIMTLREKPVRALIYKTDRVLDLALLKLDGVPKDLKPLPHVSFAKAPPVPGQSCAIVGHPSSGMLWTFRKGEVASIGSFPKDLVNVVLPLLAAAGPDREALAKRIRTFSTRRIVMTSCGANPGDSGGPVVDESGDLIAVTFGIPRNPREAKFSYHVHLKEVNGFLEKRPEHPTYVLPDAWEVGPNFELDDEDEDGKPDALVAGLYFPSAFLFDLDNDTPGELASDDKIADLVTGRKWDFEVAVHLGDREHKAFYDTNNDGTVDMILMENEEGEAPVARFTLDKHGRWRRRRDSHLPLIAPLYLADHKLQKRLERMAKVLEEEDEEEGEE